MNNKEFKIFSYNGKKFMLTENTIKSIPGYLFKVNKVNCISVNKDLSERKKLLVVHRLITGRGLRDMRN